MKKKLYRDTQNEMIAGVCSGIAEYLDLDVTVIRLLWAVITLLGGSGIIAYLICLFIIPAKPMVDNTDYSNLNEE